MAVLINNQTGLAEELDPNLSAQATAAGTHSVPVMSPQGDIQNFDAVDVPSAYQQGYAPLSDNQLDGLLKHAHYSQPNEQAKAFIEGTGEGIAPGAFTGLERLAGNSAEDIQGRREANPGTFALGQATGLLGSGLASFGVAPAMEQAGVAAAAKLGLGAEGAGFLSRVGATAVKGAVDMAILQSGDEVAKAFINDPDQTVGRAALNVGKAAAGGGLFMGGARLVGEPLWNLAKGSKTAQILDALKTKIQGEAGVAEIQAAARRAGVDIPPEMAAQMSQNAGIRNMAQDLETSGSKAGDEMREAKKGWIQTIKEGVQGALGRTPEDYMSASEHGAQAGEQLASSLDKQAGPLAEAYDKFSDKFKDVPLGEGHPDIAAIQNDLGKMAAEKNYASSESSPEMNLIQKTIDRMKGVNNLEGLKVELSDLGGQLKGSPQLGRVIGDIRNVLQDAQGRIIENSLPQGEKEAFKTLNQQYRNLMQNTINPLNDRLHVGKFQGAKGFISALREMTADSSEKLSSRLMGAKNDVAMQQLLSEQFPDVAQSIKNKHIDDLLSSAFKNKARELNPTSLFNKLHDMEPEAKNFFFSKDQQDKLQALEKLWSQIPQNRNPSGTARAMDRILGKMGGGVSGAIGFLTGHPIAGFLAGTLGKLMGREFPDAARLAVVRALGSTQETSAPALKAMFNMASAAYKGTEALNKAARNVFSVEASKVLSDNVLPMDKHIDNANRLVATYRNNPEALMEVGGDLGHYMPETAQAMGTTTARAASYLNSIAPNMSKDSILGAKRVPNSIEINRYKRAASLVQQPLIALQHIKEGTLTPEDVSTLTAVHPASLNLMRQKLSEELVNVASKGTQLPYKTQQSLSLFLGMPLMSALHPANLISNQAIGLAQQQQRQMMSSVGRPGKGASKIQGASQLEATPEQSRAQAKLARR